ncbi:related to amidases related to nicotinamidase [Ramularia collo-cygni]|uniref:Related to amidases related to nicotinamidase n=1 Tax=Ramularia collo-cygni TaxID=112498 RepID=A0A2D3VA83_9PEZI|nr:related to amidases related to nicotinamidase [Ramularia collo-cygni]CZT23850.1 related to amidases related to nicotinamidase [Ramularia collo-cygni]
MMPHYLPAETGLLLIDIQKGFNHPTHWGSSRSTPQFEANIASLLSAFRNAGAHIFHVCHHSTFEASPLHPSKESAEFMPYAAPLLAEKVFPKTTNSPFIETALEQAIKSQGIKRLVVCGLMTAHCVATTVRMASNLNVVKHSYGILNLDEQTRGAMALVSDGTATFDVDFEGKSYDAETVHAVHLATMKNEFCDVETTEEVLAILGEQQ